MKILGFILLFISINVYSQKSELIDKRALKHYSIQQIEEMPIYKIHQTNYLLKESFIVEDEFKNLIDLSKVDALKLGVFRKEKERVRINIDIEKEGKGSNLSKIYIILLSYQEVDIALAEIKEKYQNQ